MTYRVKISDHSDIIHSANEAILRYMESSIGQFITITRTPSVLSNAWREHYGVEIVYDEYEQPEYLDFRDERHFIIFSLKAR
jgi:hypothetical protein